MKKIKDFLTNMYYKFMPASKSEVLNARYEIKLLIDAIKEIEATNRTDIVNILQTLKSLKTQDEEKKPENANRGQYQ